MSSTYIIATWLFSPLFHTLRSDKKKIMKRKTNVKMLLITRQVDFYSSAKAVCEAFIRQQTQSCPELHKKLWILRYYLNLINTKTQKCAPLLNFLGVPYLQHSTCTRVTWVLELSWLFMFTYGSRVWRIQSSWVSLSAKYKDLYIADIKVINAKAHFTTMVLIYY